MKPSKAAQKNKKKRNGAATIRETILIPFTDLCENAGAFVDMPEETCPFFAEEEDVLLWCVDVLSSSPAAFSHLRHAAANGWSVAFADMNGGGFLLDLGEKAIFLDRHGLETHVFARSAFFRTATLLSLVRALRDIWQEERLEKAERLYAPESFLILSRLRAADMDVFGVLVAWELRQQGYGAIWRHVIGSPEGDMALAFTRRTEREGIAGIFSSPALAAAFVQWFGDEERIRSSDHEALEFLDDVLRGADRRSPFGRNRIGAELAELVSMMPGGGRYLEGYGPAILSDPAFHDMQDEVNQAHLLHIMRDLDVIRVGNVPFRDANLARRIFPDLMMP